MREQKSNVCKDALYVKIIILEVTLDTLHTQIGMDTQYTRHYSVIVQF